MTVPFASAALSLTPSTLRKKNPSKVPICSKLYKCQSPQRSHSPKVKRVSHPLSHFERHSAAALFSGTARAGKTALQSAFLALFLLAVGERKLLSRSKDMAQILRQVKSQRGVWKRGGICV